MTVVVPHFTHGGGVGWNGGAITNSSLISRREREWLSATDAQAVRAAAGDAGIVHETAALCVWQFTNASGKAATRRFKRGRQSIPEAMPTPIR
jgi:hypothetical protein